MFLTKRQLKKIQDVDISNEFLKTPEAQKAIEKGEREGLE